MHAFPLYKCANKNGQLSVRNRFGCGVGLNGICWVHYKIEQCGYEGYEMDNEECFTNAKKVTNAHIQIIIFPTKTLFRSNHLNMEEGWDSH